MRSEIKTSQQLYYSFCFVVPLGSIPEIPAETCKEIKASEFGQAVSGDYWFDSVLPGKIILLPCNMETEGQWLYESVKDRLRVMFTRYRIAFSWQLEESSGIAWTATTPNWKNSSTHTSNIVPPELLAERVWFSKCQSSLSILSFQSSFYLLIYFCYCPKTCSHYTKVCHTTNHISDSPLRSVTELAWRDVLMCE